MLSDSKKHQVVSALQSCKLPQSNGATNHKLSGTSSMTKMPSPQGVNAKHVYDATYSKLGPLGDGGDADDHSNGIVFTVSSSEDQRESADDIDKADTTCMFKHINKRQYIDAAAKGRVASLDKLCPVGHEVNTETRQATGNDRCEGQEVHLRRHHSYMLLNELDKDKVSECVNADNPKSNTNVSNAIDRCDEGSDDDSKCARLYSLNNIEHRVHDVDSTVESIEKAMVTQTNSKSLYSSTQEWVLLTCVVIAVVNPLLLLPVIYLSVKVIQNWRRHEERQAQRYFNRAVTVTIVGLITGLIVTAIVIIYLYQLRFVTSSPQVSAMATQPKGDNYNPTGQAIEGVTANAPTWSSDQSSSEDIQQLNVMTDNKVDRKEYNTSCVTVFYTDKTTRTTCL